MIWLVKFYLFNTINKEKDGDISHIKDDKFLFIYKKNTYNYAAMLFVIHSSVFLIYIYALSRLKLI